MLLFVHLLLVSIIMCLHPKNLDICTDLNEIHVKSVIEPDCYDQCDYVLRHTTKPSDLSIVQLNVRGIISKRSKIQHFLNNTHEADIILLCETWLTPFSPNIDVPGYEFYHIDRHNKKGGGVGILIKNEIRHELAVKLKFESECFENISLLVALRNGRKLLVSSM